MYIFTQTHQNCVRTNRKVRTAGFGLIEVIVAIGLFVIISAMGVSALLQSLAINRLAAGKTYAQLYAEEGVDAVRALHNRGIANLTLGTYGLSSSGNQWNFSGSSDARNGYTRQILVEQGRRSGGALVDSGGTPDTNLFKVTTTVSWNFAPTRTNTISLATYFTDFRKAISTVGNWASITQIGPTDLSGANDGTKIVAQGNYVYLLRAGANPNFVCEWYKGICYFYE